MLYKLLAKSIGMKYGIMPTFMAKPWGNVSRTSQFALTSYVERNHNGQAKASVAYSYQVVQAIYTYLSVILTPEKMSSHCRKRRLQLAEERVRNGRMLRTCPTWESGSWLAW